MRQVTLDTNILVSATIAKGNEFELIRLAKIGDIRIVLSPQILNEFKEVISRKKFGFSEEQIDNALKQILDICVIVLPTEKILIITEDPEDNKVLECAVCGECDSIISGDRHLLDLTAFRNVPIVTAAEYLSTLKES